MKKSKEITAKYTVYIEYSKSDYTTHLFNDREDAKEYVFDFAKNHLNDNNEEKDEDWFIELKSSIEEKSFTDVQRVLYYNCRVNCYIIKN